MIIKSIIMFLFIYLFQSAGQLKLPSLSPQEEKKTHPR